MRKLILAAMLLLSVGAFAQPNVYEANTLKAKQIYLRNVRIDSVSNDTNLTNASQYNLVTQFAIKKLVQNNNVASIAWTNVTGKPTANGSTSGILSSSDWNGFNGKQAALNGTGLVRMSGTTVSYDNTAYAADNLAVHLSGAETITGVKTYSPSVSASSSLARGIIYNPTITATANNDTLVGADISPNYVVGSYTGTQSIVRLRTGSFVIGANNYATMQYGSIPSFYVNGGSLLRGETQITGTDLTYKTYFNVGASAFVMADYAARGSTLFTLTSNSTAVSMGNYSSNPVNLLVGNSARMTLFNTGNVSIGAGTDGGDRLNLTGNLNLTTAGNKIKIATGTNGATGTATLSSGTVTVNTTAVTASSQIFLTVQETGTYNGRIRVSARVASTSFTISSSDAGDNCVVGYEIRN